MKKNKIGETYLVLLISVADTKYTYTIAESNKELASLINIIDPMTYIVASITPLANIEPYREVYKKLLASKKPDNLEFGKFDEE